MAAAVALHVSDHQHVGTGLVDLEIIGSVLGPDRRGERPKALAELDLRAKLLLHIGFARIAKDGAVAERAWPELHADLEPADGVASVEAVDGAIQKRVVVERCEAGTGR